MRNPLCVLCGVLLLSAACNTQPETPPAAETAAPQDRVPAPPAAAERLSPDTLAPATTPTDTIRPRGTGDAVPPAASPSGSGSTPAPAGGGPTTAEDGAQDGAAILQRASTAYENLRSLRADFVMQLNNPLLRQQTTSRGTLYQRRPDRIALRFSDPAGDVLLSDGQNFWIYYPSIDAKQVIRCPAAEGGDQGVDLQAQFVGDPVRRFRYTLHGREAVGGRNADVLTLEPRERTDYRTLKVWLDTRDALARRFEITEQNGNVRRFELMDFEVNPTISDATFRFTPPDGARVVSCS